MIVGYDANNAFRNSGELGDYSRELLVKLASGRNKVFQALLFSTRIKSEFRTSFTSHSNVSTYVPVGLSKLMPAIWMRFSVNTILREEKVKIYHGLNEELPYGIMRDVKTIVTCYGLKRHYTTSLMDSFMWRFRMRYAFRASDAIVAISDAVRQELIDYGVQVEKIHVIGSGNLEVNDQIAQQYFELYQNLLRED